MKTHILLTFLLCATSCRDKEQLQGVDKCGQPCYQLEGKAGVGQCQTGHWECPEDGGAASCAGQVGPQPETCDNVDNDCNGQVDEDVHQACSNACGQGLSNCVSGIFIGCSAPEPQPETCNGFDDDCDGKIDEAQELPLEFCYEGPTGTAQFGECHPGVLRCALGKKYCYGQQLPTPEACNGRDDNCDGKTDESGASPTNIDIVFILDNSGSMSLTIGAVKGAANSFAATFGARQDLRWGLVAAPPPVAGNGGGVRLIANLGTAADLAVAMQTQAADGSGDEPTLDGIYDVCSSSNPLGLTWKAGSQHVVVLFTDEEPQSYRQPLNTEPDIAALIQLSGTKTYVFTTQGLTWAWSMAMPPYWGQTQVLSDSAVDMQTRLETIIKQVSCK